MKSRTSSCKRAALGKDLTRFWPVWALYLIGLLLIMLQTTNDRADVVLDDLSRLSIVNALYALVCAALLFGDLYNTRLCYALHAMPLPRGSWFAVHCKAGFLFSLVPNLVTALLMMLPLGWDWPAALFWLAGMELEFIFFFGLAVLCVFCVGNRVALALLYGILNFLAVLVSWYIDTLYIPRLSGVIFNYQAFYILSPLVHLCGNRSFSKLYDSLLPVPKSWIYLLVIAAVGIGLLLLARMLYRRRKLEWAGDFIVVRPLMPVCCLLYTLTAGTVLYLFNGLFWGSYEDVMLFIGIIVGFLSFQMLQQRTVKVFRPKILLVGGVLMLALYGSLWVTSLDPLGIARYVPPAAQVESVEIGDGWYYGSDLVYSAYAGGLGGFTEAEDISAIRAAHQSMIDDGSYRQSSGMPVTLCYTLSDGSVLCRNYRIDADSAPGQALKSYFSSPACIFGGRPLDDLLENTRYATVDYTDSAAVTGEDLQSLIRAIWADCEAGTMAPQDDYHYSEDLADATRRIYWVTLEIDDGLGSVIVCLDIRIHPDAENTLAWLAENDLLYESE